MVAVRGLKGGRAGGGVGYACGRSDGVAMGGNVQEGPDEETMGTCGKTIPADILGRDPTQTC